MKLSFVLSSLIIFPAVALAQPGTTGTRATAKPPVKPVSKTAAATLPSKTVMTNLTDSASYAIGYVIAGSNRREGLPALNSDWVVRGCMDVLEGKPILLDDRSGTESINRFVTLSKKPGGLKLPAPSKPAAAGAMKNVKDSASYSIGMRYGAFYRQYGITQLSPDKLTKGCEDIFTGKPSLVNDQVTNQVLNNFIMKIQEEKAKATIEAGTRFLEENRKRDSVKTTASGLQYEVIKEGTGNQPKATDSVTCLYKGTFIDGQEFDGSERHGGPITFALNKVIRGWTEGLQLMKVGSKYKFYIPYNLAYGAFDNPGIPGGSALIFEVELLDVKSH